jgi:hypothetical protein
MAEIPPTPGYWMYEASGVLRPAIEAYLAGGAMTEAHIALMRAYLRQWIMAPAWMGVEQLRRDLDGLTSRAAITAWLDTAAHLGLDPL